MPDTMAGLAQRFEHLAQGLGDMGTVAARQIGVFGVDAYDRHTRSSGLLPASGMATHGRIHGRNRPADTKAKITQTTAGPQVLIYPTGDLWYVRAFGRSAVGAHAPLRFTKKGRSRRTKVRRGTNPLAPSPQLYQPAQADIARAAPAIVQAQTVKALARVFD